MILKYIFIMVFVPGIIGRLISVKNKGWLYSYMAGFLLMLAVFQIVALIGIFVDTSLTFLIFMWLFLLLLIFLYFSIEARKNIGEFWKGFDIRNELKKIDVGTIIVFLLVAFQTFMLVKYVHYDADDAYYVGMAVTSWDTDSLMRYDCYTGKLLEGLPSRYVLSPFPIFTAAISKMIGCHPAIVAHTFFPAIFIPMAYVVYTLIGRILFDGQRLKNEMYLIFVSIMYIFCYWSIYNQQVFLLYRVWQGKAILAGVLLPMLFYMTLKFWTQKYIASDWIILFCLMVSTTLVSSMGIMLGAIALGTLGIMLLVVRHDVKNTVKMFLCAVPNIILAFCYLFIR